MSNMLKDQKSAYLQQHANNPINWWPFCDEAIKKSSIENKPIFLSIGYSTCHWCHVMDEESFSDPKIANILNEKFISIKVDKEEFPEVDDYFQEASKLFTGNGGWPLNAFLTHELKPFFVGTYFPKYPKDGLSSFSQVLEELSRVFSENNNLVMENAKDATETILNHRLTITPANYEGTFPHPESIIEALKEHIDLTNGGFGKEPKFPHFSFNEWFSEQILENIMSQKSVDFFVQTIDALTLRSINDVVRGGIHRYSSSEDFNIPHFEKMLYDQAGFLKLLAKTSIFYPTPGVIETILQTLDYLEKEMLSDDHYFFSSQDSDSENQEGLYFTFLKEEVDEVINNNEELKKSSDKLLQWFEIKENGNFKNGLNTISFDITKKSKFFQKDNWELVTKFKTALLNERANRVPPFTDNKGVASWNFQLISALCDLLQYCKYDIVKSKASTILNNSLKGVFTKFLKVDENKKTYINHSTTKEDKKFYLEDYVFFVEANMRLYEISANEQFKGNFTDALKFIFSEFFKENKLYTTSVNQNDSLIENLPATLTDNTFKSPVATLMLVLRRARFLVSKEIIPENITEIMDNLKNSALSFPIASGEALRALTYPDDVFRSLTVSSDYATKPEFQQIIPNMPIRFVINYHNEKNEKWEICSLNSCLESGNGIKELKEQLFPKQPDTQKN